jgi:hypothetical protein
VRKKLTLITVPWNFYADDMQLYINELLGHCRTKVTTVFVVNTVGIEMHFLLIILLLEQQNSADARAANYK